MYEQISYTPKKTIMEMKLQLGNEKSVFEAGNLAVKMMKVKKLDASRPPTELLVVAPEAQGRYPVVLFCHGYCTQTSWYSQLLCHISSHGYILVAPKWRSHMETKVPTKRITIISRLIDPHAGDSCSSGLHGVVVTVRVRPSVAGSRCSVVLAPIQTAAGQPCVTVNRCCCLRVVPMAGDLHEGRDEDGRKRDKVATGRPRSVPTRRREARPLQNSSNGPQPRWQDNVRPSTRPPPCLQGAGGARPSGGPHSPNVGGAPHPVPRPEVPGRGMPVAVVGMGLGSRGKGGGIIPPLAPDGCNHSEFFNESRPPCCYFLAKEYGHCDVLDDEGMGLGMACRRGKGCKEKMRRGVGGVVVSFLHAYLRGDCRILDGVVAAPDVAPILLDPVIYVKE
ncbi:hypothetical protein SASPL_132952 [Salvia splendens]|uniref:1-alkyl-2-acetylglycerophosphocholine esterase n=1 Tax=Salvia splendens TaxID=180675 RepID=A0A8X8X457_SALSN|nr:hypothetical protein SASPL_132952 [Salvia splendens]